MNIHTLFAAIMAFVVVIFILTALPRLAVRIGLSDTPNSRKLHVGNVPLIGGIAMFCGFVFGAIMLPISLQEFRALLAAGGLLVFMGILDDFHELSARARLVGQLLAALLITVWGNVTINHVGDLLGMGDLLVSGWLSYIITIFAIMSVINALNMLDGLDGLAGTISLVAMLGFTLLAWHQQNFLALNILVLLCVVLCAFLPFNWRFKKPAKVFMGDAGSTFLGLTLVWFAIYGTQQAEPLIARPVTMLWILALPLSELLTIFIYRLSQHRSPFSAGREHLHHLLLNLGWPNWRVVLTLVVIAIVLTGIGIIGEWRQWSERAMFLGFLGFFCSYCGVQFWLRTTSAHEKKGV
jgi:UDP-GlcNAc:undecaprenyl-phosphate GlcNAc-1-phosphate transferase